ncbi:hypothetical protein [Crystallibacter crystallopoietes]|uniref:hypothetical protein n=1 Tax=Crystallibacter crystallopoietes TaxID=37928 RepID=UPI0005C20EAF|nr:hypothetical protein [Arthrobacter crystallopoietes]
MPFPLLAGAASTVIFTVSMLPMLVKAGRSKDLSSYSLGNIALSNLGNLVHSVYVFSLPAGPVWVLHSFYLVSSVLMLAWYLRYEVSRFGTTTGDEQQEPSDRSREALPAVLIGSRPPLPRRKP